MGASTVTDVAITEWPACGVCGGACELHDVVDFNRHCEENRGLRLPLSGAPVYYVLCGACGFCFAPQLHAWPQQTFAERIYNDDYGQVDPDYAEARPARIAQELVRLFGPDGGGLRHIDYGGGSGSLSRRLAALGWNTTFYDPFTTPEIDPETLGGFDLVTAIEVFEHVPDVGVLMRHLSRLRGPGGAILFTTVASDGEIAPGKRLTWWYAAPRNGHISLYSRMSLHVLAETHGFHLGSFDLTSHVMWSDPAPPWLLERLHVG